MCIVTVNMLLHLVLVPLTTEAQSFEKLIVIIEVSRNFCNQNQATCNRKKDSFELIQLIQSKMQLFQQCLDVLFQYAI